jgi:transcriptional regulator with XRE-family HTH domain
MRRTTHPSVLPLVMLRLAANVTQLEMAGRLGRNPITISNWETGATAMTLAHAAEYAEALGWKLNPMTFTLNN